MRIKLLLVVIAIVGGYAVWDQYYRPRSPWERKANLETPQRMEDLAAAPNTLPDWPPRVGERFPDIQLTDHAGAPFSIASLRGKPALIELAAMTCTGCQAYSGAAKYGGFGGYSGEAGFGSIDEYARTYGGVDLFDSRLTFVQLIVYNLSLVPPVPSQLASWRSHFHLDQHANTHVVTGGAPLASGASFRMIPGFLLLDGDGVVRFDATGYTPRNDLYRELLPAIRGLMH